LAFLFKVIITMYGTMNLKLPLYVRVCVLKTDKLYVYELWVFFWHSKYISLNMLLTLLHLCVFMFYM